MCTQCLYIVYKSSWRIKIFFSAQELHSRTLIEALWMWFPSLWCKHMGEVLWNLSTTLHHQCPCQCSCSASTCYEFCCHFPFGGVFSQDGHLWEKMICNLAVWRNFHTLHPRQHFVIKETSFSLWAKMHSTLSYPLTMLTTTTMPTLQPLSHLINSSNAVSVSLFPVLQLSALALVKNNTWNNKEL